MRREAKHEKSQEAKRELSAKTSEYRGKNSKKKEEEVESKAIRRGTRGKQQWKFSSKKMMQDVEEEE